MHSIFPFVEFDFSGGEISPGFEIIVGHPVCRLLWSTIPQAPVYLSTLLNEFLKCSLRLSLGSRDTRDAQVATDGKKRTLGIYWKNLYRKSVKN